MLTAAASALFVGAYLVGTFPTAHLVGRRLGFDPTREGSGNPGASNTVRVGGRRAGVTVFVGDAAKGMLAAGAGLALGGHTLGWVAGGLAIAGHMWPVTRRFRGGKGVATSAGVGVVLFPLATLPLAGVFALVVALTGTAAAGSIVTVAVMPIVMLAVGRSIGQVAVAELIAIAIIVRHRDNIDEMFGRRRQPATDRD